MLSNSRLLILKDILIEEINKPIFYILILMIFIIIILFMISIILLLVFIILVSMIHDN
jgi:hypothetical protein